MHMYVWYGYSVGEFLFAGANVVTRWAFALTWILLFVVAFLFEGSKVYLARTQREATKKLYPYRSDERRNLLCEREPPGTGEAGASSHDAAGDPASRGAMFRTRYYLIRILTNLHQTVVFVLHNTVGYILMLAVMVYNAHLILAVVLGMTLGYFIFGTDMTKLQMQCFATKRVVVCTPECDERADGTTPPMMHTSLSSESDFFICQTRTCVQPSHYFPANPPGNTASTSTDAHGATCHFGAKSCPSKVAAAKKLQAAASPSSCHRTGLEDAQLLQKEQNTCCAKEMPKVSTSCCANKSSQNPEQISVQIETVSSSLEGNSPETSSVKSESSDRQREESPKISCCHTKAVTSSQEKIVQ